MRFQEPSSIFADLAAHKTSEVYNVNGLDRRTGSDFGSLTTPEKSKDRKPFLDGLCPDRGTGFQFLQQTLEFVEETFSFVEETFSFVEETF